MSAKKPTVKKDTIVPKASKKVLKTSANAPVQGEPKTYTRGGVVFEVTAVIPVQAYGNIQPKIQIICNTIEEGRNAVMPMIEELFRQYAETKPAFLGKIEVTEKVTTPTPAPKVEAPVATPSSAEVSVPSSSESTTMVNVAKPEAVQKAEKAISLAATVEAVDMIRNQIVNSVKIPADFKSALTELADAKRTELDVF